MVGTGDWGLGTGNGVAVTSNKKQETNAKLS
jgi:hypothetical protein